MKTKIYLYLALFSTVVLTSCDNFLTPEPLATDKLSTFFKNDTAAISVVNAAYVPLQWQFGVGTYSNEWFVGDVVSDDALKGGASLSDMQVVWQMENFQTTANNEYLESFYNINYQGIFRSNFAIENISSMDSSSINATLKNRLIGESKFLRALYHFRLMRLFGGVIIGNRTFNQTDVAIAKSSESDVVKFIRQDLDDAIKLLPLKSQYASTELGRATKGAAQALLMRVILFDIKNSTSSTADYNRVISLGDSIAVSGEYTLNSNYSDCFKVMVSPIANFAQENGPESVFEIQYMNEGTSDYGQSPNLGYTRGNFDPVMTRSRAGAPGYGWGFNRPTQDLYSEFETGDNRRDEAILPYDAGDVYGGEKFSNGYHSRKASLGFWHNSSFYTPTLAHDTRGPGNTPVIRYSDVLLMIAEAACEANKLDEGVTKLNLVRQRAKNSSTNPSDPTILPLYPYGTYSASSQTDLRAAIRHERRVEFAMEGQRWFDLVRWGIADQVMNAYRLKYSAQEGQDMSEFVKGKHELFPIPEIELNNNPKLIQNPGY